MSAWAARSAAVAASCLGAGPSAAGCCCCLAGGSGEMLREDLRALARVHLPDLACRQQFQGQHVGNRRSRPTCRSHGSRPSLPAAACAQPQVFLQAGRSWAASCVPIGPCLHGALQLLPSHLQVDPKADGPRQWTVGEACKSGEHRNAQASGAMPPITPPRSIRGKSFAHALQAALPARPSEVWSATSPSRASVA